MKRTMMMLGLAISALAFIALTSTSANAAFMNSNMNVSATMVGNCTIATGPIAFGSYTSGQAAPLDMPGSVDITCTVGTLYTIDLNGGNNGLATTRQMSNGAGSFLTYSLYWDPGFTQLAGTAVTSGTIFPVPPASQATGTGGIQNYLVQGRIPGLQTGPSGAYTDVVVATVNY